MASALELAENPRSVLFWLRYKKGGAHLLKELLSSGNSLSHELLDAFPHRQAATHLRHLLVHLGVLPVRDENVARTEQWMERFVEGAGPHKTVLQPYAMWTVLRRTRQRAEQRGLTRAGANYARSQVSTALAFLHWLDEQGTELQLVTQTDVDNWLADGITTRYKIADFINWAKRCRLCGDVSVVSRTSGNPENFHSEEEQVELLKHCVQDADLPLDVRAAGSLVLLYGVPVSRIVQLTLEHVEERSSGTYIALGQHPVLMPPAVAQLVVEQARTVPRSLVERPNATRKWLFPGNLAGRPTGATPLANRLISHGIAVRPAKNSAVLALASDLPASILSEILGVHINTAVDWVRYMKRDWAAFIEARASSGDGPQETR